MNLKTTALIFASLCLVGCTQSHTPVEPVTTPDYATAPLDLSSPTATAHSMMIAMYRGDVEMVDQVFAPEGVLRRLRPTGEIVPDGLPRWRDWVGTLEVGQAHEELFDIKVERFDTLATVWAPFIIHVDGELVGCGVNQFTMAELEGNWRIVSGIDVQAEKEGCAGFREIYLGAS